MRQKHLAIMGGTFDPIHRGHLEMAAFCLRKFRPDQILFLPSGNPPHKPGVTDKHDRLEMVRRAVGMRRQFSACDAEVRRPGVTYTLDTLRELARRYPGARFSYIIGADTLKELFTWHEIREVVKRCDFWVVGRDGVSAEEMRAVTERARQEIGAEITFADHTGLDISSTEIRRRAARGESVGAWVPKAVERYIKEHGLYGC